MLVQFLRPKNQVGVQNLESLKIVIDLNRNVNLIIDNKINPVTTININYQKLFVNIVVDTAIITPIVIIING